MTRPSNRELKVLSHMENGAVRAPSDYVDVGEKTFAGMLAKGWIVPAESGAANGYVVTPKGLRAHEDGLMHGRWKR